MDESPLDVFNRLNASATVLTEDDVEPRTLEELFARDALIEKRNAESPWRALTLEDLLNPRDGDR